MRITDLLDVRSVSLDAAPKSKQKAIDAAVALMVKSGKINDEEAYKRQVYAREEESTTGIGEGIAIHMENVTRLTVRDLQQWLSGKVWILIP